MARKKFSIFFLTLFLQAVFYPAVIFVCFAEKGSDKVLSLPVDFPDNGSAYYFGFNNNEEETQGEHSITLFQELHHVVSYFDVDEWNKSRFGFIADHNNTHKEVATPPPEVI